MEAKRRRKRAQVLYPQPSADHFETETSAAPTELEWCVDYLWRVRWNVAGTHTQRVIPRPAVHLVAEEWQGTPRLVVYGVATKIFERELVGDGQVLAVAFRPGGFWPFLSPVAVAAVGGSAAGLVDRVLPAGSLLGVDDHELAARLTREQGLQDDGCAALANWLSSLAPSPDPVAERVAVLVETVENDPSIASTQRLADVAGV